MMTLANTVEHIREGDGTPLQHSCLENPVGRGAWWAAVHGVAKSQTRLKRLSSSSSSMRKHSSRGDSLEILRFCVYSVPSDNILLATQFLEVEIAWNIMVSKEEEGRVRFRDKVSIRGCEGRKA